MQWGTTGSYNVAVGDSVFLGTGTSGSEPTGSYNIGLGYQAGYDITTGQYNFLGGYRAGYNLTTPSNNTFVGNSAGYTASTGFENTFVGFEAGYTTNGSGNIAVGKQALKQGSGGDYVTAIGMLAGGNAGATSKSVYIGFQAGYGETSDNKLHIASGMSESLIEGDFSAKTLTINGSLGVTGKIIKSSSYTTVTGDNLLISAGSITVTLPSSPSAGDTVVLKDGTGSASTTSWTVGRNGSNIASSATDLTFDKDWAEINMTYVNSTIGWSI
jgi:hypothetical protein